MNKVKRLILFLAILTAVSVSFYSELILNTGIVYTHLYYYPIVVSGLWFTAWTLPLSLTFSIGHILLHAASEGGITPDSLLRSVILFIVGLTVHQLSKQIQQQHHLLELEKNTYRSTLLSIGDAVVVTDREGRITQMNPIAEDLLKTTKQKVVDKHFSEVMPLRHLEAEKGRHDPIHQVLKSGKICYLPENIILDQSDGDPIHIEDSASPIFDEKAELCGVIMVFRDITEKIRQACALAKSQLLFQTIFDKAPLGIVLFNTRTGKLIQANAAYSQMLGRALEDLTGIEWINLTHPDDIMMEDNQIETMLQNKLPYVKFEKRYLKPDGEVVWANVIIAKLSHTLFDSPHHLALVEDITEVRASREAIDYLQQYDVLTGLHNRQSYERLVTSHKANPIDAAALYIDIDGLKALNQIHGHLIGDRILKSTAQCIRALYTPEIDAFRIGDDEFFVLMQRADLHQARQFIDQLKGMIIQSVDSTNIPQFHLTIGLAYDSPMTLQNLHDLSESAMYTNKLVTTSTRQHALVHSLQITLLEKSHETEAHAKRLSSMAMEIGKRLDLSESELSELQLGATLHDIGKICVDESILEKKGPLTSFEWMKIKRHPEVGYRIAKASEPLSAIADVILSHHERYDGRGYPHHLSGESIPLFSRIIAIVDAFDAMTQPRPYGRVLTREEALHEIRKQSGTQFDPHLVAIFLETMAPDDSRRSCRKAGHIA